MKCYYELAQIRYHKPGNKTTLSVIGFAYIILVRFSVLANSFSFAFLSVEYGAVNQMLILLLSISNRRPPCSSSSVCKLCRDHEKAGFIEGIKIGVILANELTE